MIYDWNGILENIYIINYYSERIPVSLTVSVKSASPMPPQFSVHWSTVLIMYAEFVFKRYEFLQIARVYRLYSFDS